MTSRARTAATIATSETSATDMRAKRGSCTDEAKTAIHAAGAREETSMMSVTGRPDAAPTMMKKIDDDAKIETETTTTRLLAIESGIHPASSTAPNRYQQ